MAETNIDCFHNKIYCVILGTDIASNSKYILSLEEKEITLPSFYLENKQLSNLDADIIRYAQTLVYTNELELYPQLISLHNRFIEESEGVINIVYGFVVKHTNNINNAYWIPFDYLNPNKYSNLIFEVVQKLK